MSTLNGEALVSDPMTTGTEDELVAAALALVEAKKWLERVTVRQSAAAELRKAEDKIVAARARLDRAAEAHVDAPREPPTAPYRSPGRPTP
jgi:hypothetical protein